MVIGDITSYKLHIIYSFNTHLNKEAAQQIQ